MESFIKKRSVCIFALTRKGHILLKKHYRKGLERILMDLPFDSIDFHDEPITAARLTLREETGFDGELEFIGTSLDNTDTNIIRYNFVAKNCVRKNLFHEVVELPMKKFITHLRSGQLLNIDTSYLALDYLGVFKLNL